MHAAHVFAPGRIQESTPGELFMYSVRFFRQKGPMSFGRFWGGQGGSKGGQKGKTENGVSLGDSQRCSKRCLVFSALQELPLT